jgi:hypothetical protein
MSHLPARRDVLQLSLLAAVLDSLPFKRSFRVDVGGRKLMLKAASAWRRQIEVHDDDALIGRIGPTGWAGRTSVIDLPSDLPLPVQLFLFWLVIILWRRDASGAVGVIGTT